MKAKTFISAGLLLFVCCSVAYIVAKEFAGSTEVSEDSTTTTMAIEEQGDKTETADEKVTAAEAEQKVIVYYFYNSKRCVTCRKFEAYSEEAVREGFAQELKAGRVKWQAVNVDEPQNRHFLKDYQLYSKSVVLVDMQGDKQVRWKNLDKIWELVRNKEVFVKYIQDAIDEYMRES